MSSVPETQHRELAAGRWRSLSLLEQLANAGSEVERALSWAAKGNAEYSALATDRALELLDLTIADPKNRHRLKEITRLREALLDYFVGSNEFASSSAGWHAYFHAYGTAVAIRRQAASARSGQPS
jgi:hypothetical protein